ncbi:hypothetical protein [Candidatus Methanodesulfokora washburnensis]|nr:hypothetical protein [Candidatus Methanodesulfokores washburnensis]
MRAGISRVVVEIIILVIAVALALLIFSPISGYIFGSLGRTSTVGGASQIQVLNARYSNQQFTIYVKNLGPGTIATPSGSFTTNDFKVYVDGTECNSPSPTEETTDGRWDKDEVITITCGYTGTDGNRQHNIVLYGPGNTQAQYLYYPPPS